MLYFDLDVGTWVKKPGSTSPPQMTPVLTIGGVYELAIQFCRGTDVEETGASAWFAGVKIADDHAGDYLDSDNAPTTGGDGSIVFSIDLTTVAAKAYFTTNPTEDTVKAIVQFAYTVDSIERRTTPFPVVIQNDYIQDQ